MVAINPFSYEQVTIIFIFLSILLGVLLFVRKNRGRFTIKLQNEKAIFVMEDTAISPSERLRLIKVGDEIFLMASGKGVSAQLVKLASENSILKQTGIDNQQTKNINQSPLSESKAKQHNKLEPTAKSAHASLAQTKSIFDAIKQARTKNPLLGLNK